MTEYHVHVNALGLSDSSATNLAKCGFACRPFDFSTQDTSYTPLKHYSCKSNDPRQFELFFDSARQLLKNDPGFVGYIEGEYVGARAEIASTNGIQKIGVPFKLVLSPPKIVREAELHVLSPFGSHLTEALCSAGFYKSAIVKSGHLFEICTAQGTTSLISELHKIILETCEHRSDKGATVKVEVLSRFFSSEGFNWFAPQAVAFSYT